MTLTQMRYFYEVCKWRSITKAAASLHISQPTVSIAMADLEKELQKRTIAGFRGVKEDLDPFGMGSVVAVCGKFHVTAGVANPGAFDAGQLADQVLHPPEAASGQYGTFSHTFSST